MLVFGGGKFEGWEIVKRRVGRGPLMILQNMQAAEDMS